jgi:hypothetical protein
MLSDDKLSCKLLWSDQMFTSSNPRKQLIRVQDNKIFLNQTNNTGLIL